MRVRILVLVAGLAALGACAPDRVSLLDRELAAYRYEQERFRKEELADMYRQELDRSDELTRGILTLREENRKREKQLEELRARLAELTQDISETQERLDAEGAAAKPR